MIKLIEIAYKNHPKTTITLLFPFIMVIVAVILLWFIISSLFYFFVIDDEKIKWRIYEIFCQYSAETWLSGADISRAYKKQWHDRLTPAVYLYLSLRKLIREGLVESRWESPEEMAKRAAREPSKKIHAGILYRRTGSRKTIKEKESNGLYDTGVLNPV